MCGNPYRVYLTNLQRETNGGRPGWVFCWPKHPVDQEAFAETLLLLKLMVQSVPGVRRAKPGGWRRALTCQSSSPTGERKSTA
jgi:hypothetical protein